MEATRFSKKSRRATFKKRHSGFLFMHVGELLGILIIFSLAYFFLLGPIRSIFSFPVLFDKIIQAQHLKPLYISLLPVYLAVVTFGSSYLGKEIGKLFSTYTLRK